MTRFLTAAAFLSLAQPVFAQASPCVTREEVQSLSAAAVPGLVDAAVKKCAATLPADAFLRTGASALGERLRAEAKTKSNGAIQALGKMTGEEMPEGLSNSTVEGLISDVMGAEITKDIDPEDCGLVDEVVSSLAPLPSANIAVLFAALLQTGNSMSEAPFQICKS